MACTMSVRVVGGHVRHASGEVCNTADLSCSTSGSGLANVRRGWSGRIVDGASIVEVGKGALKSRRCLHARALGSVLEVGTHGGLSSSFSSFQATIRANEHDVCSCSHQSEHDPIRSSSTRAPLGMGFSCLNTRSCFGSSRNSSRNGHSRLDVRANVFGGGSIQWHQTHHRLLRDSDENCSMGKAFSSMVFIMKTLQSYALQMRSVLFYEDIQGLLSSVHREVQATFLWLFQQVFASTPTLMVLVMLLFSDFTVHSAGANLSEVNGSCNGAAPEVCMFQPSDLLVRGVPAMLRQSWGPLVGNPPLMADLGVPGQMSVGAPDLADMGDDGRGRTYGSKVTFSDFGDEEKSSWRGSYSSRSTERCSDDQRSVPSLFQTVDETVHDLPHLQDSTGEEKLEKDAMWRLLEETVNEMSLKDGEIVSHFRLDQEVIRQLVAPVRVNLEPDKYLCFDRTDLQYQHAIDNDPANPMLLGNYAQFLYVVRHDNARAESYFQRAMAADPTDGDVLGRYATFLWLARGDRKAADGAYKAAIASDPANPYFTGSYAHFLWHAGDDDAMNQVPGEA